MNQANNGSAALIAAFKARTAAANPTITTTLRATGKPFTGRFCTSRSTGWVVAEDGSSFFIEETAASETPIFKIKGTGFAGTWGQAVHEIDRLNAEADMAGAAVHGGGGWDLAAITI